MLWLSREEDSDVPIEKVHLGTLIENTHAELDYLLVGKNVSVNTEIDDTELLLSATPALIVLNNLIRNAFQHTQHGTVKIKQQGNKVIITNVEFDQDDINSNTEELGFGLGMQLVEKLTNRFGWNFLINNDTNGYQVSIFFQSQS